MKTETGMNSDRRQTTEQHSSTWRRGRQRVAIPQAFNQSFSIQHPRVYTGRHQSRSASGSRSSSSSKFKSKLQLCRSSSAIYCRSVLYISGRRKRWRQWRKNNENDLKWGRKCLTERSESLQVKLLTEAEGVEPAQKKWLKRMFSTVQVQFLLWLEFDRCHDFTWLVEADWAKAQKVTTARVRYLRWT